MYLLFNTTDIPCVRPTALSNRRNKLLTLEVSEWVRKGAIVVREMEKIETESTLFRCLIVGTWNVTVSSIYRSLK